MRDDQRGEGRRRALPAVVVLALLGLACQGGPDFSERAVAAATLGEGLPAGFLLGVATSAYQTEGGNDDDWTEWEKGRFPDGKPHVADGRPSGRAVGSYALWLKDIEAMEYLGANAYRLSIEWARLEPEPGVWDPVAVAHYRAVLQSLRDHGITPLVTVHHFVLPTWVAALGGWEWAGIVPALGTLGEVMGRDFGDLVDDWVTLNEPTALVGGAYVVGLWPPGVADNARALQVLATELEAHGAIARGLRRGDTVDADGDGRPTFIGLAHNMMPVEPASSSPFDLIAATLADQLVNRAVPDAIWKGVIDLAIPGTPPLVRQAPELRGTFDYLGLNYYRRTSVRANLLGTIGFQEFSPGDVPHSDLGWEIYPQGLYELLMQCKHYGLPVLVTENGVADATDTLRPAYLRSHLYAIQMAVRDGADVRGYFHWSLMDNYELLAGFTQKLGLFAVDPDDPALRRVPKPSAQVFREAARGLGHSPSEVLP